MPHAVDIRVGAMIRQRRWLVGMTQQQLADKVGVKFQQVQKYETGTNRVSASRLWDIAAALGVPISFFFDVTPDQAAQIGMDRGGIEVMRIYMESGPVQRRGILNVARAMVPIEAAAK